MKTTAILAIEFIYHNKGIFIMLSAAKTSELSIT
jgi:hypothetical protein